MTGSERITAERLRQIEKEGWTVEHDAQHDPEDLIFAGICYALPPENRGDKTVPDHYNFTGDGRYMDDSDPYPVGECTVPALWPWDGCYWKPSTRERDLEKAGALIAAALDRMEAEKAKRNEAPS